MRPSVLKLKIILKFTKGRRKLKCQPKLYKIKKAETLITLKFKSV